MLFRYIDLYDIEFRGDGWDRTAWGHGLEHHLGGISPLIFSKMVSELMVDRSL